jgi:hypothetical protein
MKDDADVFRFMWTESEPRFSLEVPLADDAEHDPEELAERLVRLHNLPVYVDDEVAEFSPPAPAKDGFGVAYHALVHSPALGLILKREHSCASAVER